MYSITCMNVWSVLRDWWFGAHLKRRSPSARVCGLRYQSFRGVAGPLLNSKKCRCQFHKALVFLLHAHIQHINDVKFNVPNFHKFENNNYWLFYSSFHFLNKYMWYGELKIRVFFSFSVPYSILEGETEFISSWTTSEKFLQYIDWNRRFIISISTLELFNKWLHICLTIFLKTPT